MKMSSNTSERRKELGNKLDMITPRHLSATGSMSNALGVKNAVLGHLSPHPKHRGWLDCCLVERLVKKSPRFQQPGCWPA